MYPAAGTKVRSDAYYDVSVPAAELKPNDVVVLGGRLAYILQVSRFMGAHDVVIRRPGSINASCFHVRGDVRLIQRGK